MEVIPNSTKDDTMTSGSFMNNNGVRIINEIVVQRHHDVYSIKI